MSKMPPPCKLITHRRLWTSLLSLQLLGFTACEQSTHRERHVYHDWNQEHRQSHFGILWAERIFCRTRSYQNGKEKKWNDEKEKETPIDFENRLQIALFEFSVALKNALKSVQEKSNKAGVVFDENHTIWESKEIPSNTVKAISEFVKMLSVSCARTWS
jgi:hypothetical protein